MDEETLLACVPLGEEAAFAHALRVAVEVDGFAAHGPAHGLDVLDVGAGRDGIVRGRDRWIADRGVEVGLAALDGGIGTGVDCDSEACWEDGC